MSRLIVAPALFALVLVAPLVEGQSGTPTTGDTVAASTANDPIPRPANDSLFRRARRLVSEGNGVAGRALVDSLLAAADPSAPAYGDALYWHGALAPTAAAAEADYRRVIVEYPLAYYSGDALLAIAELEQARGDRAAAMQHLQRYVREHPDNPGRGIAALGAARLAFEQRDTTLACTMLVEARRSAPASDVELRNQIAYYGNRCASVPAAPPAVAATPTPDVPAPAPVDAKPAPVEARPAARPTPAPARVSAAPAPRTATRYTVQVAAFDTRGDADALVKKLATRGLRARVSGTSKPFRVRLALHATRREANDELSALRKRGIDGFVAEEASTGARTP
jgi:cell division protein FtsN